MTARYEVISNLDGGVVFGAESVDYEARIHRKSSLSAARKLAAEHGDDVTGETLSVRRVP